MPGSNLQPYRDYHYSIDLPRFSCVMVKAQEVSQEQRWLSLGLACSLLNINQSTLRHWADDGLVRAYRTPGGHRRFAREDIYALMDNGQRSGGALAAQPDIDRMVLNQVRRRLLGARMNTPGWRTGFDAPGQERMRTLGRRLLQLCIDSLARGRQADVLAAARELGHDHGVAAASPGVPLTEAIQAFTFFRNAVLDAIKNELLRSGVSVRDLGRCWQQLDRLTDEALLGLTRAYQEAPEPSPVGQQEHPYPQASI